MIEHVMISGVTFDNRMSLELLQLNCEMNYHEICNTKFVTIHNLRVHEVSINPREVW